jgi:hypothetical protein
VREGMWSAIELDEGVMNQTVEWSSEFYNPDLNPGLCNSSM